MNINPSKISSILLISYGSSFLLAIWPLPETIAFRNLVLILVGIIGIHYLINCKKSILSFTAWPIWVLAGTFIWLPIQLLLFSIEPQLQLLELKSVWLRSGISMIAGLSLGLMMVGNAKTLKGESLKSFSLINFLFFVGLAGTCIIFFIRYLYEVYLTHQLVHFDFWMTPYLAKTPFVVSTALLSPLCCILLIRIIHNQINKIWAIPSIAGILLTLFSNYFANTKNGMVIFTITLIFFMFNILFRVKLSPKKLISAIILVTFFFIIFYVGLSKHIQRNPAWNSIFSNIKIGLDIDNYDYWKDKYYYPQPLNEVGELVDGSTYERTAWFMAAGRLLKESPAGFGLLHHSFGRLALAKWTDFSKPNGNFRGATHSGWMDMALGIGIPGILLIWIPLFSAWYRSLFKDLLWFSYTSWTIPIMMFAYLISEVAGTHFTEMLFFMTAFFCGITLEYPAPTPKALQKIDSPLQ